MDQLVEAREAPERTTEKGWEPRIVAMVCNWCTYAGADMAGTARRVYAPSVRIVRFLCTGRIDPLFIVKAFEQGADGVVVSGCHPGDCHYVQGNLLARRRFTVFQALMDFLGLDRRRLHFAWISASEGVKWSRIVDEATAAVREAGPLRHWGRPVKGNSSAQPLLPDTDAGIAPRDPPSAEENQLITGHLQELVTNLLSDGTVSTVIGYTAGSLPQQMVPLFVNEPRDASTLGWNEHCANNLVIYLPQVLKKNRDAKIGLVTKSCDARALIPLIREGQLRREQIVLLGIPCRGMWNQGKMAAKCYSCSEEVSPFTDWTITPEGTKKGSLTSAERRQVSPDPRDREIASLGSFLPEERWDYWQRQFDRCLRCYACRAVCPLCYCATCISDKNRPQWIPTTIDGKGNMAWNVVRAMHLAGRCIGCDECARLCPAGIRLDLLNRGLVQEIERRFDFCSHVNPESSPPLTTFQPDDPDEFI